MGNLPEERKIPPEANHKFMKNRKEYKAAGLMSGTSLDGLDIAVASFSLDNGQWHWELIQADTVPYPQEWADRLRECMQLDGEALSRLHVDLGNYFGRVLAAFLKSTGLQPDLVASHGHTVFHQPEHRLTLQIGAGTEIHVQTGLPVVCDFRTLDLALGGQGAPLVPVGDQYLFGEYDACLNLGGIANISYDAEGRRMAYDICPCNMVLNHLAARAGKSYDPEGSMASAGQVQESLLEGLNRLEFYEKAAPKSLGLEYVESQIFPLLRDGNTNDLLRTAVEHTAYQITQSIRESDLKQPRVLVTGGGAMNTFLIDRMRSMLQGGAEVVVPSSGIVSFKEALVFAFLGVLRVRDEVNVLSSVTGASRDSSSGVIFGQM